MRLGSAFSGARGWPVTIRPAGGEGGRISLLVGLLGFAAVLAIVPTRQPYQFGTIAAWLLTQVLYLLLLSPVGARVAAGGVDPRRMMAGLWDGIRAFAARPSLERIGPNGALVLILLLAAILRLVALDSVPPIFDHDEGEFGVNALAIAQDRPNVPAFFATGWMEHPALHWYLQAVAIKFFGATLIALRVVTGLWSLIGVLAVYLAGRDLVNGRVGLIAAAIAATAPVDLHFSRYALNNVETGVFSTLVLWSLYRAFRSVAELRRSGEAGEPAATGGFWASMSPLWFGLAGVFGGLSLYFYHGGRLIPILMAVAAIFALFRYPARWRTLIGGLVLALVGAVIAILPIGVYYYQLPGAAGGGRAFGQLFVPTHVEEFEQRLRVSGLGEIFWVQLRAALGQFLVQPDGSPFFPFGVPVLLAPVAALFVGGLILATLRLDRTSNVPLLIWFWGTLIVGNVLFGLAPYTPRVVGLFGAVFIFAGLALDWFLIRAGRYAPAGTRPGLWIAAVALLAAIAVNSINDYFFVYFRHSPGQIVSTAARYLAQLPPGTHVISLNERFSVRHSHLRYLGHQLQTDDLRDPPAEIHSVTPKAPSYAFVVGPRFVPDLLPVIEERFPGGQREDVKGPNGDLWFTTYTVLTGG